jgi:hypothetical protein
MDTSMDRINAEEQDMRGAQMTLLKADDGWVARVDQRLHVREPISRAIYFPLRQISDGC